MITDNANLSSTSGYAKNSMCLFYIDADQPDVTINLKVHVLHLECLWDYLQVFDGDSIFSRKIATYTYAKIKCVSLMFCLPGLFVDYVM